MCASEERPFFVVDLGTVYQQYLRWQSALPNITAHYAMKCNSDLTVLQLLLDLGAGLDCASAAEIETAIRLQVSPARIIYAHPCKTALGLDTAHKFGINRMTFDSTDELEKISRASCTADLLLRIWTEDDGVETHLSRKFGARLDQVPGLLRDAQRLKLHVSGVSFHVGTNASRSDAFADAIRDSRQAFQKAFEAGIHLRAIAAQRFPEDTEVIAEPGRMLVEDAFTLTCKVIGKRVSTPLNWLDDTSMLYLSDGVYGNFANVVWESQNLSPGVVRTEKNTEGLSSPECTRKKNRYVLWGPTCDGNDCIMREWVTEYDVHTGQWLYFPGMGAYSSSCKTNFNGFGQDQQSLYVSSHGGLTQDLGSWTVVDYRQTSR
ncbi:hypothetical protein Q7P37_007614 [Cladosporium fusiforme]